MTPEADESAALLREIRDILLRQEEDAAKSLEMSKIMMKRQAEALETQKGFTRSYRKITPVLLGLIAFVVGVMIGSGSASFLCSPSGKSMP